MGFFSRGGRASKGFAVCFCPRLEVISLHTCYVFFFSSYTYVFSFSTYSSTYMYLFSFALLTRPKGKSGQEGDDESCGAGPEDGEKKAPPVMRHQWMRGSIDDSRVRKKHACRWNSSYRIPWRDTDRLPLTMMVTFPCVEHFFFWNGGV